ncbi:A24 family peptidase [Massilia cavernae]|uniref:Prepilin type IV endopeptidase peptidase domain-containing protein n=1 Tax=Massilia cavernae TaxID=2320864 RepID=A0A418XUH0_9BURK|nr:prepilin peptidase [Massilia cavernae]RJG16293.1 hypothetical protein D3872_11265 [Massilia cavernae]
MSTLTSLDLFLIALVLAASVHDLVERKIPNRLIGCGLLSAAVLHLASGIPFSLLSTGLAGLAVGFAVFFPLYCVRGMAAGDVKLMAMAGAFTGPVLALEIALAAFCIGGLMALAIVLARGLLRATLANMRALLRPLYMRLTGAPATGELLAVPSVGGMPYGVAIAAATMLVLVLRHG